MKMAGILLLIVGLIMTAFTGFNIITQRKVVDIGSVEITQKRKTPVYWSPLTGGVLAIAGLALFLVGRKKT